MTKEEELIAASEAAVEEAEDIRERLRHRCLKKGYNGILALGRFLRSKGEEDTRTINSEEVIEAIQEAGLEITEDEGQGLVEKLDPDGTGTINYEELIISLRPEMNDDRKEMVEKAFDILDESGDGLVTIEDLKGKYDASNHPKVIDGTESEDQVLERFLNRFEGNTQHDGQVTKEEFSDYYSGISKVIEDDEYFIEMMRSCWKIE